ncbi:MAG: hypothetical protein JWO38_8246 [Gemmataceae bacterium]|nr:hypothetical protein [Gemmataceae bacterium]
MTAKRVDGGGAASLVVGSGDEQAPSVVVFPGVTLTGASPPGAAITPFTDPTETSGVFVG